MPATDLANLSTAQDRYSRLDQKLRRELGEGVLKILADGQTEDICLNPDSTLCVKRTSQPLEIESEMSPSQAPDCTWNYRRYERNHREARAAHP
jgi:hypothetical protein